ncbi:PREDICTED: uncharacterized protein LOC108559326 [Nicrophorus vespilloides]|uniref:Uncharacterized protein LOC108559326 n=1 Tax=Nicrophorus vespilloides TaxID=110193 RepID=A0ABM1MBV6_NICVS|nr:PREDICTED: uncharacterized protein LOC108559326 [Nicrophorus vespilloides]
MSKKTNKHPPPLQQQQNLLYNQDGEYVDTYLESLSQDCTATQTTSDSEWKYDNCGCGMNIPWHMITYKMKQNEKPECPPCPPTESPSMTRLKELTVGPIDQDQFIDLTQEVLNDQLATDDMTIPDIEKQVIEVAGRNASKVVQENDPTAVYRPKPKAEQVYDPKDERHNEPYMDKMFTYFPGFFEDSSKCSSRIEMPWTNILLPKNCSIRKTYKPPKQQKKTSCGERKHAPPVKKESKSKIRVKKISRIHVLNSKEAIAITSTLSNLILNPPSKPSPGSSYSQSYLMKPKNKSIEMTNSISHESNLMSIYNLTTPKGSKKKTKKSHASIPMVKSKGSKHSLSKGSISKSSVSKAAKIRSKTDRITSLLDSCKKEMEPIKEGINKLRARIRELNLPDFHETKPANPYCMSSSYGAMMGTELSFTYSQAMPMHCFPCPPYFHAPLYPPMPNMKSGITKRVKHRNQINRQTSVSETDSDATPFSDGEEESCSCLGHRAESKHDSKAKLPKEPKKCEDGWDFQIATRIGRTNCFELPTNNEKPTKRNKSRGQKNAQNEEFCKCNKRKSNYKSCGYCQDYEESDNNNNNNNCTRPIAEPEKTNICCKCKEHNNPEPTTTTMDWFCKCEQKNAPGNFKVFDQVGCFCPPSTEGDSSRYTSCDCSVERDLSKTAQYRKSNESSVSFADSCTCSTSRVQSKIQQNTSQKTIDGSCNCSLLNNQSQVIQSQKSFQQSEISLKQKCDCVSTRNQSRRSIDESTLVVKNTSKMDESRSGGEKKCSCSSDKKYKSEVDVVKKPVTSKLTREPSEVGEVKRRCRCCTNLETGKKCTCSSIKKPEESEPKPKKKCVCSSSKSPVRVEDTEKPKKKCNSCQTSAPRANKSKTSDLPPTIIKEDMQCTCKKIIDPMDENKPKCACTDGMSKLTITSSKSVQKSASISGDASTTDGTKNDPKTTEDVKEPDADEKSLTDKEVSNELKSKSGSISKNVTSATQQATASQAEVAPEENAQSEANIASPKLPSHVASKALEERQKSKSGSITSKEFSKQLNESLQKVKSGESSKQEVVSSSKQDVQKSSKQDVQGSRHSCKARIPIKRSSYECECSNDELQVYHSPKEFSKVPCKNRTRASYNRRSRSCLCETAGDESSSSSCDYVSKVKPKSRARSCECNDIKPLKPKRLICQKTSTDSKEFNRPKSCECDSKDSQKSARNRTHESSSSFEMKRKKEPECDCEETKRNFDNASDSNACGQEVVSTIECPEMKKQEQQDSCECPSSHSGSSDKKVVNKPSKLPTLCAKSSDESENNLQIQQSYVIKGDKVATRTVASWVRPCTKVIRKSFEDVSCSPCDALSGSKVNFKAITITSKVNVCGTTTPPAPSSSLANTIDETQGCLAVCNESKSEPESSGVDALAMGTEDKQDEVDVGVEKSQVSTNTSFVKKKKIYKESKETNTDMDDCCYVVLASSGVSVRVRGYQWCAPGSLDVSHEE